jgi:hypothetical protein
MNHVEAALVPLNTSNRTLTRAVAELQKVPTKRVRVRAQIAGLVVARTTIRAAIRSLEKLK